MNINNRVASSQIYCLAGAYDACVCLSEAVGPSGGGGALVALDADLDLGACVHVSHELDEGGGKDLGGGRHLGASVFAHTAAVEGLSVGKGVCLSGGGRPSSSLSLGLGATEGVAAGCACAGGIGDGAGGSNSGHIPDDVHVPLTDLVFAIGIAEDVKGLCDSHLMGIPGHTVGGGRGLSCAGGAAAGGPSALDDEASLVALITLVALVTLVAIVQSSCM